MAKVIMVQGTMSNAGKSLIVAGLCRIFKQDGYRVAPFKSQNMALNSFITEDGLEMGRAQVMQAEAAGIKPSVYMNPILLKPTNNIGSQVIVNGEVIGNMPAKEYFAYKKKLIPDIKRAFLELSRENDIIVIEGAGSPAEINLKENDIVNMGMAAMVDAPVLLVGDIDRGGVFAQLLGTLMLLEEEEKERVKGLIINKFRGDKTILDPGIDMLEERGHVKVAGVVPYMKVSLEDEDSLSSKLEQTEVGLIDIAVIRFPRISNFTDFDVFSQIPGVKVRYVDRAVDLQHPDLVILPGSKNTMGDLKWMRQNGLEAAVKKLAVDTPVFGICGGYQMLGMEILDPYCVEEGDLMRGMELLPEHTVLQREKHRSQCEGEINVLKGIFGELSGKHYLGYEIHMGSTQKVSCQIDGMKEAAVVDGKNVDMTYGEDTVIHSSMQENTEVYGVYGTYVHGIFDHGEMAVTIVRALANRKGIILDDLEAYDYLAFKEQQYDLLAQGLRESMDIAYIYEILREVRMEL